MIRRDAFERILASLHEAAMDDARLSTASALIDDALGVHGNCLAVRRRDIPGKTFRIYYARFLLPRDSGTVNGNASTSMRYFPLDERIPRLRLQLPDSQLVHMADLFTEEELKTSASIQRFLDP